MKNIKFLLVCFVLLFSCQKETLHQSNNLNRDDAHSQYALESRSSDLNHYIVNINDFDQKTDIEVPIALLVDINNGLTNLSNWDELEPAIAAYGDIRWNWSSLNVTSNDFYRVIIPVFNDKKVTALIQYSHVNDHFHFDIVTYSQVRAVTENWSKFDIEENYIPFIYDFNYLQYLSDGIIKVKLNDWIVSYIESLPEDRILPRNEFVAVEGRTLEIVYNSDGLDGNVNTDDYTLEWVTTILASYFIPCNRGGVSGGTPPPPPLPGNTGLDIGGTPPPPPNPPTEEEEEVEEEVEIKKEIKITKEDCKNEHMTRQAIAAIEDLINTEFPCNEGDSQAIADEIMEELCSQANMPNADEDFHGIGGSITVAKIEEALSEYNSINLSGLDDCPNLKCIMEYLLNDNGGNFFCENIRMIDANEVYSYSFNLSDEARPSIGISEFSNTIVTNLPNSLCHDLESNNLSEQERIDAAMMLIHETLHTTFANYIINDTSYINNPGDYHFNPNNATWSRIAEDMFGDTETNNHHYLFYTHMMDIIMTNLWDLNSNQGSIEDYRYLAHIFVNTQDMFDRLQTPLIQNNPDHWLHTMNLENFSLSAFENSWNNILLNYGFEIGNCI